MLDKYLTYSPKKAKIIRENKLLRREYENIKYHPAFNYQRQQNIACRKKERLWHGALQWHWWQSRKR